MGFFSNIFSKDYTEVIEKAMSINDKMDNLQSEIFILGEEKKGIESTYKNRLSKLVFELKKGGDDNLSFIQNRLKERHESSISEIKSSILSKTTEYHILKGELDELIKNKKVNDLSKSEVEKHQIGSSYELIKEAFSSGIIDKPTFKEARKKAEQKLKNQVHYADMLVFNRNGELLLLQRSLIDDMFPSQWCLPGGHVDPNEEGIKASQRELEEEALITLTDEVVTKKHELKNDKAFIEYFEVLLKDTPIVTLNSREHQNYEWVSIDKINDYDLILDLKSTLNEVFKQSYINSPEPIKKALDTVILGLNEGIIKYEDISKGVVYKYIKKEWVNGKWNYVYSDEKTKEISRADVISINKNINVVDDKIEKAFQTIKLGYEEGLVSQETFVKALRVYSDNAENRKLNRVGQTWGSHGEEETSSPKTKKEEDSNVEKSIDDDILEKSISRPKKDLSKLVKRKVLVIRDGRPHLAYRYVKTGEEDETYKPKIEPKMKEGAKKVVEDLGSAGIGEGDFIEALSASGKKISGEIIALSIPDSRGLILAKIDTEDGTELMSMSGVKSIKKITPPLLKFPEVSDLKFEKSLGGSSDVKLATFDGNSYAVKKARDRDSGEKQLRFEVAADEMYRIVGIDTPMSEFKEGHKISKFITGQEYDSLTVSSQKAFRESAKKGFVMDCLLANWDVVGSSKSNMIFSSGKVYRIDNGGVFDIRARGGKKEYTSTVNEDTSLFRENPDYADIFKGITDDEIKAQLQIVVSKKKALLEACPSDKRKVFGERIENMLEKYGISDSKTETPEADKKVKLRTDMPSMVTQNYFDNGWDELELIGNPGMKEHIKNNILSFEKDKESRYQDWAEEVGMTVEELKADMQKELEIYVSRSKIFKAVHSGVEKSKDVIGALLKGGKFLSQFEIDESDGALAPYSRATTEHAYFGFDKDIAENKEVRPQYGYATPNKNGVHNKQGEIPPPTSVRTYGDVFLELDNDSYKKATLTVGDSLGYYDRQTATPFTKPHFTSFERLSDYMSVKSSNKKKDGSSYDDRNYLEVQLHNGLFINEMKKAHISQRGSKGRGNMVDLSKRMNNIVKAAASSGNVIELEIF